MSLPFANTLEYTVRVRPKAAVATVTYRPSWFTPTPNSPYRHVGMVIDGVATPWLKHTVYGRSDAGSLSMFRSDSIERATLQAGAYPQRYDDRLGAQLDITLREGRANSTGSTDRWAARAQPSWRRARSAPNGAAPGL